MAGGYTGKYVIIDLGKQTTQIVEPDEAFYKKYLSGYGLGAAVIMERQKPGVDPLAAESHLGFCSGLLTGTKAFFSGRFMVVGKSPLTGGWGDANAGGFLSRSLKRTGYDAVFFTGCSQNPVWIDVTDQGISFNDASDLWGKDTLETEKRVKEKLGDSQAQVASIGISGEGRSLISGISTDRGRLAARSGLGAVMGSKNLKAVSFHGKFKIPVAHPDRVKTINQAFIKEYQKSKLADRLTVRFMNPLAKLMGKTGISVPTQPSTLREILKQYGTAGLTVYSAMTGDMPVKNWGGVGLTDYSYESAIKNSDDNVIKHQKKRYACQSCPLGCGGIIDIEKGKYKGTEGHKPEYETLSSFGGLLLNDDLHSIIELNEMCNRAGIDTISAGAVVAFAIECFENNIIGRDDLGGLDLGWGKTEAIIALTDMIIQREGFGDLLADGVKRAAQKIGRGSEVYAVHAGGQELPMHDPKLDPGFAIAYECEPTPGRHTISSDLYAGLFNVVKNFPQAKQMIKQAKGKQEKNVRKYAAGSIYNQLINAGGMCLFGAITSTLPVVEYMNAVTGWDLAPDDYFKSGERILSLRKAFNVREGILPGDHKINARAVGTPPLESGPLKNVSIDAEALKKEFFQTLGWDLSTGGPTMEKMSELSIDHFQTRT